MSKKGAFLLVLALVCAGCSLEDVKCSGGTFSCDGTCIDPKKDVNYCGASNCMDKEHQCLLGQICSDGECIYSVAVGASIVASGDLEVTEDGKKSLSMEVHLNVEPVHPVDVVWTTSDPEQGMFKIESGLTDTVSMTMSEKKSKSVTVVGVPDDVVDGSQMFTVRASLHSKESAFSGYVEKAVTCIDSDASGLDIVKPSDSVLKKKGDKAQVEFSLLSKPSSIVVVPLRVSNSFRAELDKTSLSFTPDNWNTHQVVTVTRVDDDELIHDIKYFVQTGKTSSDDSHFDGLDEVSIEFKNQGRNEPGLVTRVDGKDVDEVEIFEGETTIISVSTGSKPMGKVHVTPSVNGVPLDAGDKVLSFDIAESLDFDSESFKEDSIDWRFIEVEALMDHVLDRGYAIDFKLTSTSNDDLSYHGLEKTIHFKVKDADSADFVLEDCDKSLIEGTSMTCGLRLSSKPQSDVWVKVVSASPRADAEYIDGVFTPENWFVPQEITISTNAVDTIDDPVEVEFLLRGESVDTNYNIEVPYRLTLLDANKAALVVSDDFEPILDENMCEQAYSMRVFLAGKPTKAVTITPKSEDDAELAVSLDPLTIEPEKWNTGVNFVYHCVDDAVKDGDRATKLRFESSSEDEKFDGLSTSVDVTVVDNDIPGMFGQTAVVGCGNDSIEYKFQTWLTADPGARVTINLSLVDGLGQPLKGVKLYETSVEFTPDNWNVRKVISVFGPSLSMQSDEYNRPKQNCYHADEAFLAMEVAEDAGVYKAGMTKKLGFVYKPFCTHYFGEHNSASKTNKKAGWFDVTLEAGDYAFLVAGAGGGTYGGSGGKGGRTSGKIHLDETTIVRAVVGGAGKECSYENMKCGGYNGGGYGGYYSGGGGGGSDIRIGERSKYEYRVIVAGGGGGGVSSSYASYAGGKGGGTSGAKGNSSADTVYGGGQKGCSNNKTSGCGFGAASTKEQTCSSCGGGGGGWWSGQSGSSGIYNASGGGGSGYWFNGTNVSKGKVDEKYRITEGVSESGKGASAGKNGYVVISAVCE